MTRCLWVLFLLLSWVHQGYCADFDKFYCSEAPQALSLQPKAVPNPLFNPAFPMLPPMVMAPQAGWGFYSSTAMKSCDGKKTEMPSGICILMAKCIYLTPEIQKAVQSRTKKKFKDLSVKEKSLQLVKFHHLEAVEALLTCSPTKSGECPMPEKCKGDVAFDLKIAPMNEESIAGAQLRSATGKTNVYQPEAGKSSSGSAR